MNRHPTASGDSRWSSSWSSSSSWACSPDWSGRGSSAGSGRASKRRPRAQIELFGAALDQYRLDVGAYPPVGVGLSALIQSPNVANWNGPYLKKNFVPLDPWGKPYQYKCCPGDRGDYDIWTYGADGAAGGEGENADVTSWDAR